MRKKRTAQRYRVSTAPDHEELPWPGLNARDRLSRVATQAVKDARETRETEVWAEKQIARVLNHVPPETAATILFREIIRRENPELRESSSSASR